MPDESTEKALLYRSTRALISLVVLGIFVWVIFFLPVKVCPACQGIAKITIPHVATVPCDYCAGDGKVAFWSYVRFRDVAPKTATAAEPKEHNKTMAEQLIEKNGPKH